MVNTLLSHNKLENITFETYGKCELIRELTKIKSTHILANFDTALQKLGKRQYRFIGFSKVHVWTRISINSIVYMYMGTSQQRKGTAWVGENPIN